jgi:hypothetical protein
MPFNPLQSLLAGQQGRQQFDQNQAQQALAQASQQPGFNQAFSPEAQQVAAFSANPLEKFAALDKRRQQIFFDDASKGLKLAKSGNWGEVTRLAENRIESLLQLGGDTADTDAVLSAIENQDFEGATALLQSGVDAGVQTGFLKGQAATKRAPKQKGEGGLVFDPNTGTYSIDELAKRRFDEMAKKQNTGKFGVKERQSINKDVSGFIKNAIAIKTTANDLIRLKDLGTGASSIAAIFKFMKANDPTSTVREGEFATAENSGGVPAAITNYYNKIMTGERIEDTEVQQFVGVAKTLANSAIESSSGVLDNYLGTFEGSLGETFPVAIRKRVPKKFNLGKQLEGTKNSGFNSSVLGRTVSEQDIEDTLSGNPGLTREQLLQQLGVK